MTRNDCVGLPLERAVTLLKQAAIPHRVCYTRSPKDHSMSGDRTPRVIAVRGDVLVVGYFQDKLMEQAYGE